MTAKIYEETVLELILKPLNDTLFEGQHWIFQQDSVLAHKSKRCQEWSVDNIPLFIRVKDGTSGSLDLNPHDHELWYILEKKACQKWFKWSITEEATKIPLETISEC